MTGGISIHWLDVITGINVMNALITYIYPLNFIPFLLSPESLLMVAHRAAL